VGTSRRRERLLDPAHWASLKPLGIGEQKPNNYRALWEALAGNRDNLGYAWRILGHGVCDGCALGTTGMRDWTLDQVHLCNVRLRLLRLNTAPPMDVGLLADVSRLQAMKPTQLHELGRLPYPMLRHRGEPGFRRVSWDEALDVVANSLRSCPPERLGVYMTSRGQPNENYYVAQKAVRALGTNSIDSAARLCHSPSTLALKSTLGVGATTCSYADLIGTDLVVFIGSNVAQNQPVMMKYLYHARKAGTRVAVVNPFREPAMDRYWVPSNLESAIFGTRVTDDFFQVSVGGDIAFFNGVMKHMLAEGLVDRSFVDARTTGFAEMGKALGEQSWEQLEAASGSTRTSMRDLARALGRARTAVLVWSMGVTQHKSGEDAVRAIVNVALARGFVGRDKCGVMPVRGHSGVQGGAEMGAYATAFPGGVPIDAGSAAELSAKWGFSVPAQPGLTAPEMLDAAHDGRLDLLVSSGGNFLEVLPDPAYVRSALERPAMRVHLDIVVSSQMLVEPSRDVVLLPVQTRYEMQGGVTQTSTERRVVFSPEIPGPRVPEARPEWQVFCELLARAKPALAGRARFSGTAEIRAEIARTVPHYGLIGTLEKEGDQFQYGGPLLCSGWEFPTPDGKAHFSMVEVPYSEVPEGAFLLATRRGRQFNSMVQGERDGHTGAVRSSVLVSGADAAQLGLADGSAVRLHNEHGEMTAQVLVAPVAPGNLMVHWPEGDVLLDRSRRSAESGVPDYTAVVWVEAVAGPGRAE